MKFNVVLCAVTAFRRHNNLSSACDEQCSFYRAALNAGWSSREKGVYLSVRPSVKRVNCDKTEEKSIQIFISYKRSFSLVF